MFGLPGDLSLYISKYSYLILIFVILQGSLIVIIFYIFAERFATTKKRRLESELVKQQAYQEAMKALREAKAASISVLEESQKKARDIISTFEGINSDTKRLLDEKIKQMSESHIENLKKAADSFASDYQELLDMEKAKGVVELEKTTSIAKEGILSEVSSIKDMLRQETVLTEQEVKKKIQDEYSEVRQELTSYKEQKLRNIDDNIYNIISEVSKSAISTILDLDTHQKIVIELLEKAKRENRLKF